jgi:hypothetical protein
MLSLTKSALSQHSWLGSALFLISPISFLVVQNPQLRKLFECFTLGYYILVKVLQGEDVVSVDLKQYQIKKTQSRMNKNFIYPLLFLRGECLLSTCT